MEPISMCPNCGKPLKWNLIYSCGNPFVCFTCSCGYDSRLYFRNTVSTNTAEIKNYAVDWVRQTDTTKVK